MIDIIAPIVNEVARIGEQVYKQYRTQINVTIKDDLTPVTEVDLMVHTELSQVLRHYFSDIPIISEEGDIPNADTRKTFTDYWCMDPLDGTREFIEHTDEFVISLGLIRNFAPQMGVLHHPVSGKTWASIRQCGVFVQSNDTALVPLVYPKKQHNSHTILVSQHHHNDALMKHYITMRKDDLNCDIHIKPVGSALKFAYLAEGRGDEYVRFTPLHEWDIAAGHCIALESGFDVQPLDKTDRLDYGTDDMLMPAFRCIPKIN